MRISVRGGHSETMSGYTIIRSNALLYVNAVNIGLFLRETFQAVSGIRLDAGKPAMPYINVFQPFNYINDAQRAIWLASLLPPGFHLDPDSTPTTVQARIYKSTNRDPNYIYIEEPRNSGIMDFMGGSGGRNPYENRPVRKIPRNQVEEKEPK